MYQREIWSLLTGAVDTIFHGQSLITDNVARKNDKNKSISLKLKCFLIAGAHNLKLTCSATYCNMTMNTPCFSRFPIDLTWQPVSAWHHASFWNRKRRWRHRSVRIVNTYEKIDFLGRSMSHWICTRFFVLSFVMVKVEFLVYSYNTLAQGHSISALLNRHQTIWGVYVNKVGKTSVVWMYTLQSIGPSRIALNYQ